jgi:hypothetical protein
MAYNVQGGQNFDGQITIEQLIDIVNQELTISGLMPKILPDREIKRLIKEHALEWFYKNYQFAVQRSYYFLPRECLAHDCYTAHKYFIMPEEVENITRIVKIDDPSLFRLGIQAPHLSINLGVTNQPFLTSFVTTVGDLGVYRSIISAFSDEINKMNKPTLMFSFNHINKQLKILTSTATSGGGNGTIDLMLEVYLRVQQEELFDFYLFKDYVIGLAKVRQGEAVGRFNMPMPGNFTYNANDMITEGKAMITSVQDKVKGESQTGWFIMSR